MKVGILGGGQLSRMLALAGTPLGCDFCFLEPNNYQGVSNLGKVIHTAYDDHNGLDRLLANSDVITYENENIPVTTLEYLAQQRPILPGIAPIKVMQDRFLEKNFLANLNVPTTTYYSIPAKADLIKLQTKINYPAILKKRSFGYDGKGQVKLNTPTAIKQLTEEDCQHCILEEFVDFRREISIIGCRSTHGEIIFYDICENRHHHGILRETRNKINDSTHALAKSHLEKIMNHLNYVGVCALELFETENGLIANELAPRVHNSGHWTIEGAVTSQFENHLRCILNLPLGSTDSTADMSMLNIISEFPDKKTILAIPTAHLHDYVKTARRNRKLGHVTIAVESSTTSLNKLQNLLKSDK